MKISDKSLFTRAFEATKDRLLKSYTRKKISQPGPPDSIKQEEKRSLFRLIIKWRNFHASLIDENPEMLFTPKQLTTMLQNLSSDKENMKGVVEKVIKERVRLPECYLTYEKTLTGLLTQGQSYYETVMSMHCHNCEKIGHAAWGCSEPYTKENSRRYLQANPEAKRKQNNRRQLNKRRNKAKQANSTDQ